MNNFVYIHTSPILMKFVSHMHLKRKLSNSRGALLPEIVGRVSATVIHNDTRAGKKTVACNILFKNEIFLNARAEGASVIFMCI